MCIRDSGNRRRRLPRTLPPPGVSGSRRRRRPCFLHPRATGPAGTTALPHPPPPGERPRRVGSDTGGPRTANAPRGSAEPRRTRSPALARPAVRRALDSWRIRRANRLRACAVSEKFTDRLSRFLPTVHNTLIFLCNMPIREWGMDIASCIAGYRLCIRDRAQGVVPRENAPSPDPCPCPCPVRESLPVPVPQFRREPRT